MLGFAYNSQMVLFAKIITNSKYPETTNSFFIALSNSIIMGISDIVTSNLKIVSIFTALTFLMIMSIAIAVFSFIPSLVNKLSLKTEENTKINNNEDSNKTQIN